MKESTFKAVVIYTSGRDVEELCDLVATLVSKMNVAVVVDIHQDGDDYLSTLREEIASRSNVTPEYVENSLILTSGKVYLVPSDKQATIRDQELHISETSIRSQKKTRGSPQKYQQEEYVSQKEKSLAKFGRFVLENGNLQKVLNHATKVLGQEVVTDYVALLKLNEDEKKLFLTAHKNRGSKQNRALELAVRDGSLAAYTIQHKSPVVSENIGSDDRFSCDNILLERGFTSMISVVVEGSEDIYGILAAFNKQKRAFTDHEINFVHNMANMVGYAEERIRMENKLNQVQSELQSKIQTEKELQRDILEVEKKERWRLGQYLHDETAQNLLSIKMLIELLAPKIEELDEEAKEQVEKIRRMIVRIEKNVRELSHFVLPIEVDDKVKEAFDELLSQTESLYDVNCSFSSDGSITKINNPTIASSLYYITQEAIRNAINHGNADSIEVSIALNDNREIELKVYDNGVGYDNQEIQKGRGINIMRHRAALLGGSLEVKLADDKSGGTIVSCQVPLEGNQK